MRSSFFGLEIGRTGLNVSQKGLDVTGHNIANVDTAGYTRQRLVNTSYEAYNAVTRFSPVDRALVGSGSHVKILDQIRDQFLDRQFRTEQGLYSYWDTRTQGLTYVESLFESADGADLEAGIDSLFKSFLALTQEGNDREQRKVIQQNAINLCQNFNLVYNRLVEQQQSQNLAVKTVTQQINLIADNIAVLNKSIYSYEIDGLIANDLRDKRNLLIDELSTLIDIDYQENADDFMVITIDGVELVNHITTKELKVEEHDNILEDEEKLYVPVWEDGTQLDMDNISSGKLKSHIGLRDNNSSDVPGVPYFVEQLNTLAQALTEKINEIHRQGYTHPASGQDSRTGIDFFNVPDGDLSKVSAKNFWISAEVEQNEYNIAASSEEVMLSTDNPNKLQQGNQENARQLYQLLNKSDLILEDGKSVGSFSGFLGGLVLDVAITLNHSKKMKSTMTTQLLDADTQRTSISGVSLDEEMTNLLRYQHAYAGASRVITTMDEALDILINRMGRVGL